MKLEKKQSLLVLFSVIVVIAVVILAIKRHSDTLKTANVSTTVQSASGNAPTSPLPANFIVPLDESASKIPLNFYHLINSGQYSKALKLCEGVALDSYNNITGLTFLKNINRVSVIQYKDVTGNWGGMPYSFDRFYAVKVYAAVIDYDVKNPALANHNVGKKLKRLFVVKDTKNSPWKLYMEQGYSTYYAPASWGMNLTGVTNYN